MLIFPVRTVFLINHQAKGPLHQYSCNYKATVIVPLLFCILPQALCSWQSLFALLGSLSSSHFHPNTLLNHILILGIILWSKWSNIITNAMYLIKVVLESMLHRTQQLFHDGHTTILSLVSLKCLLISEQTSASYTNSMRDTYLIKHQTRFEKKKMTLMMWCRIHLACWILSFSLFCTRCGCRS